MIVKRAGNAVHANNAVTIWTPAKLNLLLEVLQRRDDGFHEIETLMSPITWRDTLRLIPNSTGQVTLDCTWTRGIEARRNCRQLPSDCQAYANLPAAKDNLVTKAVKLLQAHGGTEYGADIRLHKRIPSAAGLGGASSDAAAALLAANHAWKLQWSNDQLAELSATLGSDIPFFFVRQSAVCRGRGEQIEPFSPRGMQYFVIVKPAAGLSTAAVYGACRPTTKPHKADDLRSRLEHSAANPEDWFFNRLQEPALTLSPDLKSLARDLEQISKSRSFLSGSGTSHFVRCRNAKHARRLAALARGRGLGAVCCSVSATRGTSRRVSGTYST